MGNDSTKPNENIYFKCRKEAALYDERLRSRESAADLLGVSPSSLADYELGNTKVVPVDKVNLMADLYNAPQLKTMYCKHDCPIGDCLTLATEIPSLETVVLRLLNNLEDGKLSEVKRQLINIAATEGISTQNVHSIDEILKYLDRLVESVSLTKTNKKTEKTRDGLFILEGINADRKKRCFRTESCHLQSEERPYRRAYRWRDFKTPAHCFWERS